MSNAKKTERLMLITYTGFGIICLLVILPDLFNFLEPLPLNIEVMVLIFTGITSIIYGIQYIVESLKEVIEKNVSQNENQIKTKDSK